MKFLTQNFMIDCKFISNIRATYLECWKRFYAYVGNRYKENCWCFLFKSGPDVMTNTRMSGDQIDYAIKKQNIQKYPVYQLAIKFSRRQIFYPYKFTIFKYLKTNYKFNLFCSFRYKKWQLCTMSQIRIRLEDTKI